MASFMSSIFGEAPASAQPSGKQSGTADLFGSTVSVPAVLHSKTLTRKPRDNDTSGTSNENQSAYSDSTSLQPTSTDAQVSNAAKATTEKTEEQLKEEEERTIFVGNLPLDMTRKSLADLFKPCGIIASTRLRSMALSGVKLPPEQAGNQNMMRKVCANTGKVLTGSSTPKKTAQGYVVFESAESIKKALQMNNALHRSHTIRVDHANPSIEPSKSVFVGNLPYAADEQTLRDHFSKHLSEGEDLNEREGNAVSGVRLVRDKETQNCKGFGYVMLRDATLVPLALQLHGTTYKKRELRVMICGKRFKGNKRDNSVGNPAGRRSSSKRNLKEETSSPSGNNGKPKTSKRKLKEETSSASGKNGKPKKRRARSEKKVIPGSNGMSKRALTEQKVKKRVKKLQNRAVKGMGRK